MKSPRPRRAPALLVSAAAMLLISTSATTADAQRDSYVQLQGGASFLGEWSSGEPSPGTAAYCAEAGLRWGRFGLGLVAEHNLWLVNDVRSDTWFPASVLNIGLQTSFTHHGGHLRSGVAAGTSTLLIDTTSTDGPGQTGFFVEVQPIALRIPFSPKWHIEIEVLNLIVMAPVLEAIPLVELAYRTMVGIERRF